jgi:hypothetical protein
VLLIIVLYCIVLFLPVGCFLAAAVRELRAHEKGTGFLLRIVEIVFGIIGVVAIPSKFWGTTLVSRVALSWMMVGVSLLMCILALGSKYASRVALSLVLAGNVILACLWYLNGAYHH